MKGLLRYLFCFLCLSHHVVHAQLGFRRVTDIPVTASGRQLSLPWAGGLNFTEFSNIDLNNDGRQDLFVVDRQTSRVTTFINNGQSGSDCWTYAPQYEKFFPAVSGWAKLYDYNCDGKPDLYTATFRNNGIMLYENISQSGNLEFSLVDTTVDAQSAFGPYNIFASSYLVPTFDDIDGDGDVDILTQQFNCVGSYGYFRNRSMEDYGVCDSLDKYENVTNAWGKFAIRSGAYPQVAVGQFNITCQSPRPTEEGYEVARRDDTYANIFTIDIDGDGDKDALIGDSQTDNSLLVINGGTPSNALMVSQDTLFPSYNVPVKMKSFTAHSYVDADNDGIKDLMVSQSEYRNYNSILLYHNNGTTLNPQFSYQRSDFLQNEMIDVGEGSAPVFVDENGDGLLDMVIGNKKISLTDSTQATGLSLYRNTGTATNPSFDLITEDYLGLGSQNYLGTLNPAFGDLDLDGDQDLLLGLDDGKMIYLRNCGGAGAPITICQITTAFMSIDVGNAAAPHIADMKRDGLPDLVVGNKNGILKYYENVGSAGNPFFAVAPSIDTLGRVLVQSVGATDGFSDPFIFEYNGQFRAAVACMQGGIYLYGNIDGNLSGTWTILDTIEDKVLGNRYGYNLTVGGGDINGDSLTDLLVGLYSGGVQLYLQNDSVSGITSLQSRTGFVLYPNPAADRLVIKSEKNSGTYTITDMTGRTLLSGLVSGGFAIVLVESLSTGMYFVRVDGSAASKLFIAR